MIIPVSQGASPDRHLCPCRAMRSQAAFPKAVSQHRGQEELYSRLYGTCLWPRCMGCIRGTPVSHIHVTASAGGSLARPLMMGTNDRSRLPCSWASSARSLAFSIHPRFPVLCPQVLCPKSRVFGVLSFPWGATGVHIFPVVQQDDKSQGPM